LLRLCNSSARSFTGFVLHRRRTFSYEMIWRKEQVGNCDGIGGKGASKCQVAETSSTEENLRLDCVSRRLFFLFSSCCSSSTLSLNLFIRCLTLCKWRIPSEKEKHTLHELFLDITKTQPRGPFQRDPRLILTPRHYLRGLRWSI
jgi:hypothetical protein